MRWPRKSLACLKSGASEPSRASSQPTRTRRSAIIRNAAAKLAEAFDEKEAEPTPSDAENIDALNEGAATSQGGGGEWRERRRLRHAASLGRR